MIDESHITQLTQQAESCLDNGDLQQARRLYSEICRVRYEDPHAWLMLGSIDAELGNIEVAHNALERAVKLDTGNAVAHLALAQLHRAKGNPAEAMASASRAVEVDGKCVEAWLFLAAMAGELRQWPRAEEACRKVIALAPDHVEGHVNLGNLLLATGRAAEAEDCFRKALALDESAPAPGQGATLGARGHDTETGPARASALRVNDRNAVIRRSLADCLEHLGRSAEAAVVRAGPLP
jgi:tetratricopeptide (TPR) repeat protein